MMFPSPDAHSHRHDPGWFALFDWLEQVTHSPVQDFFESLAEPIEQHANSDWHAHDVSGAPERDMTHWHQQQGADTCAVVSQEFILDELLGVDFTEKQLIAEAQAHGWYTPGGGTPMYHVGDLLELHGIPVTREWNVGLDQIEGRLAAGEKVIVGVEAEQIWSRDYHDREHQLLADCPWIPAQGANHAVEVIGVDHRGSGPVVILNDPGSPDGCGLRVPADVFADAHAASGGFAVTTALHTNNAVPSLGGYYDANGKYQYRRITPTATPSPGGIIHRW